jgi:hypothetical protein
MTMRRGVRAIAVSLAVLITLLWAVNFFWLIGLNVEYGGGALNGFVRDGHYYLGLHGTYTEVRQAIWEQIRLHEVGMWLGVPFIVVSFGYLLFSVAVPATVGLREGKLVEERVQAVRASGARLAAKTCAGWISGVGLGGVGLGGPFLFVEVFPGGLTVRLILKEPIAILKEEVRKVFTEFGGYVIAHDSPDIASPVILFYVKGTALAAALDQLAPDLPQTARHGGPRSR